jgi:hypothetical protein
VSTFGFLSVQGPIAAALGMLTPLFATRRRIGGILVECPIMEEHNDALRLTDHPVEQGAAITDHAFKLPADLTMTVAWSRGLSTLFNSNYLNDVYDQLLILQNSRVPMRITTERRTYRNMLLTLISTKVDKTTANILLVTIRARQVLLATTQVVSLPPNSVQRDPASTGSIEDLGQQQLQPAPNVNTDALPSFNGGTA